MSFTLILIPFSLTAGRPQGYGGYPPQGSPAAPPPNYGYSQAPPSPRPYSGGGGGWQPPTQGQGYGPPPPGGPQYNGRPGMSTLLLYSLLPAVYPRANQLTRNRSSYCESKLLRLRQPCCSSSPAPTDAVLWERRSCWLRLSVF